MKLEQKIFNNRFFLASTIILSLLLAATGGFDFAAAAAAKKNCVEGEVVAKISPDADVGALAEKYNLDATLLEPDPDGNLYVLKSRAGLSTKKLVKKIQKNSAVVSVQPNYKYQPLGRTPNDKYFSREWPLFDADGAAGGVSAPSAWDMEAKKQTKVPIALIDTGVNCKQPEIKKSIAGGRAKGKNFANPRKKPRDSDGHGTFLAGIIAAKTNNKKGLAGSSFFGNLKITPLKFDFTTDQAISAINYAKSRNIPIVNASWGAYGADGYDLLLKDAIAGYPGVFVTAAGNGGSGTGRGYDHDGANPNEKMYPCDFDLANIICAAAAGRDGTLAGYSDYGAVSVDVAAPGGTDGDPIFGLDLKKNKYTEAEGSSLSAAYVSAVAGLIISRHPNLSSARVIEIIKNSVDIEPSLIGKTVSGGKINFQKALELARSY